MLKISKKTLIWAVASVVTLLVASLFARLFLFAYHPAASGYLILGVVIALLIWRVFLRNDGDELARLRKQKRELEIQLAEKSASRLNVVELNPIMHVAVLKVDTSFVRPYVREEGKSTFNGALRANLSVEYGVKLEEARFKYDGNAGTLTVANFKPGIISYSKKQLSWEFARTYKEVSLFGHRLYEVSDKDSDRVTAAMCEKLRSELEAEIDSRQVSEFDWLSPLVADQVADVVKLILGRPDLKITIAESMDESFVPIKELKILPAEF